MSASINRVKYGGLDFNTHLDDLLARLQVEFAADFNDFALSSLAIVLLDQQAFGLDTLSFYLDRRATDNFMATVRTKKSAAQLARQLGYKPGSATSSSTDLQVSLSEVQAFDVTVPKGFQFQGPNGLIFEASEAVTFVTGSGPNDIETIPCYEGVTLTESFTSNGVANQVFNLRRLPENTYLVGGTVTAVVDGTPYTEVDFLEFSATQQFEVDYQNAQIRFGDGEVGVIPPTGATILVTYVASRGREGQAPSGTIESPVSPLVVSFTTIELTVTNPKKATGGDLPEDIESIRTNAGRVFKSRRVAVTSEDYEALASAFADPLFGRVAVARAYTPRAANVDLELQNQLAIVTNAATDFKPDADAALLSIESTLTSANASASSISSDFTSIGAKVAEMIAAADTALTSIRTAKSALQEVTGDAQGIQSVSSTLLAIVTAIGTAGSSQLTTADKNTILGHIGTLTTQATDINSTIATISSNQTSALTQLGEIKNDANDIGTSVGSADSLLLTAEEHRTALTASLATIATTVNTIQALIVDTTNTVSAAVAAIEAHFTRILAADCQTNLVTVPILTRDASGFYAAPSIGLLDSLQTYLEQRNDATHVVDVVSGENFLVPAVITVRLGIKSGVSASVTKTTAAAIVDSVLRGRKFADSLYLSEFTTLKNIPGLVFVNVRINGYLTNLGVSSDKVDTDGNLIIEGNEVVTKGTVTVLEPEVVELV